MDGGYPWRSTALTVAELTPDGVIRRANAALEQFAGRALAGERFDTLIAPPQRDAFHVRLAGAGEQWETACFALQGAPPRPPVDRDVWLRRIGDRIDLIGEPAVGEQERLVEKVLELNDDLLTAHRELLEQREALERASDRIRHLEAISAAGLAHLSLDDVLVDVLAAIAAAVGAERAAILLPGGPRGELRVTARLGPDEPMATPIEDVVADGRPRVAPGWAGVPLVLDGAVIGALEVAVRVDDDDLGLLVRAADRAAVAISRAQAHERERRIAETLQRALLPDRLPAIAGLSLAARFEPAAGGVQVGGDWYDALPLPSGLVAVAIGDVAGKGVPAAALMGELRSGLRAYALEGGDPHQTLERLNSLVLASARMATVLLAVVDPNEGAVRYASAGHLPPLLVGPDGSATLLDEGRGPPLLAYRGSEGSGTVQLERGAQLVLYTDGLVERRGEAIDEGLGRLVDAAAGSADGAEETCEQLVAAMELPESRDDVAVLAVRRD
jgi:hypothetical protein